MARNSQLIGYCPNGVGGRFGLLFYLLEYFTEVVWPMTGCGFWSASGFHVYTYFENWCLFCYFPKMVRAIEAGKSEASSLLLSPKPTSQMIKLKNKIYVKYKFTPFCLKNLTIRASLAPRPWPFFRSSRQELEKTAW